MMATDNLKLSIYRSMDDARLREAWFEMERSVPLLSPFTYYDYMKHIFRQTKLSSPSYTPLIACVESETEELLMIAPIKRQWISGKVKMLGDIQGSAHADFLFRKGLSQENIENCIRLFIKEVGKKYKLKRLLDSSPLYKFLNEKVEKAYAGKTTCVTLKFQDDADAHIKSLSSSVRQNIRTAYNRMRRDGIEYELKVWMPGNRMGEASWQNIMTLYLNRLFSKYKAKQFGNFLYRTYKTFLYKHLKHDTRSLVSSPNAFHAALYSEDRLMGFMSGYADYGMTRVVIPRLAINDEFRFYSPGYVLLNETIHYLAANTPIREIDLARGTERYKADLGGELYFTHSFSFKKL